MQYLGLLCAANPNVPLFPLTIYVRGRVCTATLEVAKGIRRDINRLQIM